MFNSKTIFKLSILMGSLLFYGKTFTQTDIHKSDNNQELIIPVVFHIVYQDYSKLGFTGSDIEDDILLKINNEFNEVDKIKIDPHYRKDVASCNIKFVLAKNIEGIESITWHKTDIESFDDKNFFSRQKLMSYGYVSDDKYFNIWIADFDDRVGFGVYPTGYWKEKLRKDGIAINYKLVKNQFIPPIIHEIGHYFNLPHIWEEAMGNNENDTSCMNDDGIEDTPRQAGPNKLINAGNDGVFQFDEIEKVCGDPTTAGNYQNYMDWAYQNPSMFTKGQKNQMRYSIFKYRSRLLEYSNEFNESSILSISKQRHKLGSPFNFNYQLSFNTNIDLTLSNFFQKELGIVFSEKNLERLGLKLIGTDKFEDLVTGKEVTQDYIYKYLDINIAKQNIVSNSSIDKYIEKKVSSYFDVKRRKYLSKERFIENLNDNEKLAFKNTSHNFIVFPYYKNMTYEIFKNGSLISSKNLSANEYVKEFNLESGVYRIVCKTKTFRLGNGNKHIPYTKTYADITFEHLKGNSSQTIILLRDTVSTNRNEELNSIFTVKIN